MKTDAEIAQEASLEKIQVIAEKAGLREDEIELYGSNKAKISLAAMERVRNQKQGKLVLVTAVTPTAAGEGKTTVTIGLGQALNRLGKKAIIALREPSLGPCFGVKGGATGGGYSQVVPMEDINLHFTGDIHAVSTAHNLLADLVNNSYYFDNPLGISPTRITWPRVIDLNDRFLRRIVIGLGGKAHGIPLETSFDISVASEVMACLCLARDLTDLRERLSRIIVAYSETGRPLTAQEMQAIGSMTVLLKDAIKPNLVQTLENTPAFIHGGPFANIAHGCSSVIATELGLRLGEYLVTEAGFGADLGAEKFFDLKCRQLGRGPDAVVVVASIRALKLHGGADKARLTEPDENAVQKGLGNLHKHLENISKFGLPAVVALNRFPSDTDGEIDVVRNSCQKIGAGFALSEVWARGGQGGQELAQKVMEAAEKPSDFRYLYELDRPLKEKIETIAREIYGAKRVDYLAAAEKSLQELEKMGFGDLPICVAKTQYSLSDDPALLGRPDDFIVTVRDVRISAGARFVVVLMGNIVTLPGLSRHPAAHHIDIDDDGRISGLF
ncbi:MAG: formate--tetrahydrofolate ligase [Syntrophomonadaceae bacterium]|nr:formate--tetrahydrofolate ligase [Syntrophomonadaceae bacterium]